MENWVFFTYDGNLWFRFLKCAVVHKKFNMSLIGHGIPNLTKKLCAVVSAGKEKISFLYWILIGYINHTPDQVPCWEVAGPHKHSLVVSLHLFLSHFILFRHFLFGHLLVYSYFLFVCVYVFWYDSVSVFLRLFCCMCFVIVCFLLVCFKERRTHKVGLVMRLEKIWEEWGKRKTWVKFIV